MVQSKTVADDNTPQFDETLTSASAADLKGAFSVTLNDLEILGVNLPVCWAKPTITDAVLAGGELAAACEDVFGFMAGSVVFRFQAQ